MRMATDALAGPRSGEAGPARGSRAGALPAPPGLVPGPPEGASAGLAGREDPSAEAPAGPRSARPLAEARPAGPPLEPRAEPRAEAPAAGNAEPRSPVMPSAMPAAMPADAVAGAPVSGGAEARPFEPRSPEAPADAPAQAPSTPRPFERRPAEARAEPPAGAPAAATAEPDPEAAVTAPPAADVLTLAQWLSPAFPVGAYAYSHGLEWAIGEGAIGDAAALGEWLADVIAHGAGRSDAILLAAAHRADTAAEVADVAGAARAFAPSRERLAEAALQGAAFCATVRAVWGLDLPDAPYPVALGRACRLRGLPLALAAPMHLHAFVANLISAAVRAVPLGQTEGQTVLAALEPLCREVAARALAEGLDDLSGTAFLSDVASMRHETQTVRLFRS